MSKNASETRCEPTTLLVWLDYRIPSLNEILSAPMRARFAGKRDARVEWLAALVNNQKSWSQSLAIVERCLMTTTSTEVAKPFEMPSVNPCGLTTEEPISSDSSTDKSSPKDAAGPL